MDPNTVGQIAGIADKISALTLALVWMIAGYQGKWAWESAIKEKNARITKLEQKLEAQERLIDRLSGVADRSIGLSTSAVVRQVHEHHRQREDAA